MSEPRVGMLVTPTVRLARPLGEGGMGSVWVADHSALQTQVVVKFIAEDLAKSPEALSRFSREAAAASQVKSPHVVQTYDHGVTEEGRPYIVMELLEGRDLGSYLESRGALPPADVVHIVTQLGRALDRAHARGIVHRDIKPENIFLCDTGNDEPFVKLLDFGIAKGVDAPKLDSATKTGVMVGTPYYMSPEQLLGAKNIDYHADLWSVGVVAFEALTGKRPFDAETVGGIAVKVTSEPLPMPCAIVAGLPAGLDAWFERACARPPVDRFGSAKEMADALARAVSGAAPASHAVGSSAAPHEVSDGALARTAHDVRLATDAGVVRSRAAGGGGRGRVALVAAALLAVVAAALVVPRMISGPKAAGITSGEPLPLLARDVPPAPSASLAPPSALTTASLSAPVPALGAPVAEPSSRAPQIGRKPGRPPRVPEPAASAAPPAATVPMPHPVASGHDIF